jgi:hypothetical protein
VAAGIPTYRSFLDDTHLELRVQAAHVLAAFPEYVADLSPVLEAALRSEPSEEGHADLTIALGRRAASAPERWHLFAPAFEQPESAVLRYVAALTIARLAWEHTSEPVIGYVGTIAQQAETPPSLATYSSLRIGGGEPHVIASRYLQLVGRTCLGMLICPFLDRAVRLRAQLGDGQEPFGNRTIFDHLMEWLIITLFGEHAKTEDVGPCPSPILPPRSATSCSSRSTRDTGTSPIAQDRLLIVVFLLPSWRWRSTWRPAAVGEREPHSGAKRARCWRSTPWHRAAIAIARQLVRLGCSPTG